MRLYLFSLFLGLCLDSSKAECTSRGRFPNNDEADCRGYTMCLPGAGGAFVHYKLTCPLGSVYSHIEQQCTTSTAYQCFASYTCDAPGNFDDSEHCSSFVSCVMGLDGLVTARRINCPIDHVFNPEVGCVNNTYFLCHPHETTTVEITTEMETTTVEVTTELVTTTAEVPYDQPLREVSLNRGANLKTNSLMIFLVFYLIKYI